MSRILEKWNNFKEMVGTEYALNELEKALGTFFLTDHVRYILRMNDYESMAAAGGDQ